MTPVAAVSTYYAYWSETGFGGELVRYTFLGGGGSLMGNPPPTIDDTLITPSSSPDNELPDYIMVMLANRKTVHQINNDLQLFLGENTNRFTVWLQGMLTLTTRGDLSEGEEEEEGGEIEEEREKGTYCLGIF